MASRGDLYENRVTGERAVVLRGDVDGGGLSGLVHLTVKPSGAVVGEHVHPAMNERFSVVSGRLQTRIAGTDRQLGPGEDALATAGTPHDWWNAGEVPASVLVGLALVLARESDSPAGTVGSVWMGSDNDDLKVRREGKCLDNDAARAAATLRPSRRARSHALR